MGKTKLRNVDDSWEGGEAPTKSYAIGLDLGVGSVGWAAVDLQGHFCYIKGKPAWGSRLFPSADTAAQTRLNRGQRRRYARRRARIDCLQSFFLNEMNNVDPEFFVRMNQSRLHPEDRDSSYQIDYDYPFFNETDFTEHDYYERFPTIWHLRKWLVETDERADIRLVYLALHNIVKYRGNFLHEDEKGLKAENANAEKAAGDLVEALQAYAEHLEERDEGAVFLGDPDIPAVRKALDGKSASRSSRVNEMLEALNMRDKKRAKALASACFGFKTEFSNVFAALEKQESTNFYLYEDEKTESFMALCPEEAIPLFEAMRAAYSAYTLSEILKGRKNISEAMIASYDQHAEDLALVKSLVKDHCDLATYRELFRGPKMKDGRYDINKLPKGSYTAYIMGDKLCNKKGATQEEFVKKLRDVFEGNEGIVNDERYLAIRSRLEANDGEFLSKQKTRSNGAIPFQLHLEETDSILESQGRFYPFLIENKQAIEEIVSSRIPYYVGPLNAGADPRGPYAGNPIDPTRKFAWSIRRPGMENAKVYPWNVEEIIDTDATAELFIQRMTGTCTYLYGEPVLPRCSLLYEEFCVLNELNGAKWSEGSKDAHRFDYADREKLIKELFMKRKTVSHKAVVAWLERNRSEMGIAGSLAVSGTQGETGFESKLSSYNDFCDILGVDTLDDPKCLLSIAEIEQIILWSTVFEDRSILKRKVEQAFGQVLSDDQVKKIVKKRYSGWGRLSRKFLAEVSIEAHGVPMSIIDIMREGDPTTGKHRQAMNLMEVLRDKGFGFQDSIDTINKEHFEKAGERLTIDDMQGSPALRRSVTQAMRIVEEIVRIAGKPPVRICIEVTRDDDTKTKGSRTKTRYRKLEEALNAFKADAKEFDPGLLRELQTKQGDLDGDRLMLYFAQCGKSLYSGKPLDINRLSEYQIDHILPQSYIKDDSIENKALVLREENQRKLDSLLLDASIIDSQYGWWSELRRAGLISEKKFKNLTCRSINDRTLDGFINRQLVETSQIVKFVRQMCEQAYPDTEVVSLRASLSHGLRERCGFAKCRDLNDYHHAHDAFLACQMARFIDLRYPRWQDGFDLSIVRKYVRELARDKYVPGKDLPGRAGFIVDSFLKDGFDRETGEVFKDTWNASAEIEMIRRALNYKDCFISRMPEEQTGPFWDETVYSPHDARMGKSLSMPLKGFGTEKALDPQKYGGVTKVKQAYFFAFVAYEKNGKQKCFFEGVPLHLVGQIGESADTLLAYAEQIAQENGCSDAKILRSKIPLRQKFIMDGTEFTLCGRTVEKNEIRACKEIAGSIDLAGRLCEIFEKNLALCDAEYARVYEALSATLGKTCPKLASALDLGSRFEMFEKLEVEDKAKVLRNIVLAAKGSSQGCDLALVGGSKSSTGFMRINIASKLPEITWVDQSVTGIFEKRTTFEDMSDGL